VNQTARHVQGTKDRLLAAARTEFAAYGIAGARVDRIAERAGINKERIYGHFGNKEKLFDAVVTDALDELAAMVPINGIDPAEYVGKVYDFHRANPALLRLCLWEALHYREKPLPHGAERAARYRDNVRGLADAMGVEASHDMAMLLLTLIGLAAWPGAVPQLTCLITGVAAESDTSAPAMRAHLVRFTEAATGYLKFAAS
jgi:AcrR family transcriptional regulator